jgi:hypothetical protein
MSATKKEDFIYIISLRGTEGGKTGAELWKRQINDLLKMVGPIKKAEHACVTFQKHRRREYNGWTSQRLLQALQNKGLSGRGMTPGGMIDALLSLDGRSKKTRVDECKSAAS